MGEDKSRIYEFGPFRLDERKRLLLREGEPVKLFPKEFDTLLALVERGGEVLEKDELLRKVWGETVVEEGNLTTYISHLRKALGEKKDQHRYIVTVPGQGYSFVADVRGVSFDGTGAAALGRRGAVETARGAARGRGGAFESGRGGVTRYFTPLLIGSVALALAGLFWLKGSKETAPPAPAPAPVKSIAVLPFKPLAATGRDEALELGMADTLITKLSNLKEVTVRPTSAVRRYTRLDQDALAAGRELRVESVLQGIIHRAGDRIRVTLVLMRVADGQTLWAETFDEKFTGIFAVQDSIAERVAVALAVRLTGDEQRQLAKRYTENTEAYQAYTMGRFFWNKRTEKALKKAVEYFDTAIEKDPGYALAYVGMADSYVVLRVYSKDFPRGEYHRKAKAAALKALELDNTLAEAHASLGGVRFGYERDWPGADEEYKLAIELNPNYATARQWYAEYLQVTGRLEEGVEQYRIAQQLDPFSITINVLLGVGLYHAHRHDEAIEQLRRTLEIDPNSARAHYFLAGVYEVKGLYADAISEFQKAEVLEGESPEDAAGLGASLREAFAASGERGYWRQKLGWLTGRLKKTYSTEYDIAICHALLGERDEAFAWLERAYQQNDEKIYYIRAEPKFDGLRSDPRYARLLRRLGLNP